MAAKPTSSPTEIRVTDSCIIERDGRRVSIGDDMSMNQTLDAPATLVGAAELDKLNAALQRLAIIIRADEAKEAAEHDPKRIPPNTSINGNPGHWSFAIMTKWRHAMEGMDLGGGTITAANYYTPRPYVDTYNRGSRQEGFVYTVNGDQVGNVVINSNG